MAKFVGAVFFGLFASVLPVAAFWGPSDGLRCQKVKVERNLFGKMQYYGGPIWDLRVEMFDDQVALTRIIDDEGGDVEIMPASINKGYAQFEWDWAPYDPGLMVYEMTVDRRRNTLTMYWDGGTRWNRYLFKYKPE